MRFPPDDAIVSRMLDPVLQKAKDRAVLHQPRLSRDCNPFIVNFRQHLKEQEACSQ